MLSETGPLAFPQNFGALFLLGWPCAAVGLWAFTCLAEPADPAVKPRAQFTLQLKRAGEILQRDHNYRYFLLLRILLLVAGAAVPFFAVYVRIELGGAQSMVGVYLAVYTVTNLLSNVVFGRFAACIGNRGTLLIGALAGLIMSTLVAGLALSARPLGLSSWIASLWLIPVFAFSGLRDSGLGVSGQSLLLEIAPQTDWSLYLGFTNSLLGVVLLSTGLAGLIVAQLGFGALLGLTLVANLGALAAALRLQQGQIQPEADPTFPLPNN
jgi:MFS family permease